MRVDALPPASQWARRGGGGGSDGLVHRATKRTAQLLAASWLAGLGTAGVYGLRSGTRRSWLMDWQWLVGWRCCKSKQARSTSRGPSRARPRMACNHTCSSPSTPQHSTPPPSRSPPATAPHLCASQATWAIMVRAERASRSSSTGRTNGTRRSRASLPSCLAASGQRGGRDRQQHVERRGQHHKSAGLP